MSPLTPRGKFAALVAYSAFSVLSLAVASFVMMRDGLIDAASTDAFYGVERLSRKELSYRAEGANPDAVELDRGVAEVKAAVGRLRALDASGPVTAAAKAIDDACTEFRDDYLEFLSMEDRRRAIERAFVKAFASLGDEVEIAARSNSGAPEAQVSRLFPVLEAFAAGTAPVAIRREFRQAIQAAVDFGRDLELTGRTPEAKLAGFRAANKAAGAAESIDELAAIEESKRFFLEKTAASSARLLAIAEKSVRDVQEFSRLRSMLFGVPVILSILASLAHALAAAFRLRKALSERTSAPPPPGSEAGT
jgi:hypothetical protein